MAATYEPIASQTLGSDTATVSFTSIAADWTDLILIAKVSAGAASTSGFRARVNSDSGSNYSRTNLVGDGSSASSARGSNLTEMFVGITEPAGTTATSIIQFQSYANTNVYKTVLARGGSASWGVSVGVNLWRSTSAITSISLFESGGNNLLAGSTFSLFGIKAA